MNTSEEEKTEGRIQQEIVMWYRNEYCLKFHSPRSIIFSIPNSFIRLLIETGMMPGASDTIIVHNHGNFRYSILFIETKTPKGVQSPKQKKFQAHIEQMGLKYYIVRSKQQLMDIIMHTIDEISTGR